MRLFSLCLFLALIPSLVFAQDADKIVKDAITYWRDESSYIEAQMTVHRPDWERTSALKSWTKGMKKSLVRFTAPAKDAGNASLTLENEMWSFSPKVNKVIKIPPSMMSQAWMGSDFSYDDLSKSDDIVDLYEHKLIGTEEHEGKKVYVIENIPFESAPIVWGKEILKIRIDHIMVEREFYDQDMKLYKKMVATEIDGSSGKMFARRVRMSKATEADEWTEVYHDKISFGKELADSFFTLSSLSNPRP